MGVEESSRAVHVLAVPSETRFAADCEHHLGSADDISLSTVPTVDAALDVLATETRVDCIVSDCDLPDANALDFLQTVRAQRPRLPFILLTDEEQSALASRAITANVTEYLTKTNSTHQHLSGLVDDAVSTYRSHGDHVDATSRAKTLLDAATETIAVVRDGHFEFVNESGRELLGSASGESRVDDVLTLETDATSRELVASIQQGDQTLEHAPGALACANGRTLPVDVTSTHVTWEGTPAALLIVRNRTQLSQESFGRQLKNRVVDKAPVGITIADTRKPDNPLVYVNDQFERTTGYTESEVLGRNCRFLQSEETSERMRQAVAADESFTTEVHNQGKNGTPYWCRVTFAPLLNAAGEVTHYVGFHEEITEQKEHSQMLRRFRRAVEAAGNAIYITDTEGTITYANPAFERITGFDSEEAVGETPDIFSSGEMSDDYYDRLWQTISRGDVWEEEIRNRRKCGEIYTGYQTIAPLTTNGDIEAFVAIQTDITEQKRREEQLREYERAIEGANELIAAVDDEFQFLFANRAYREFHGIDKQDVTELTLPEVLGDDRFAAVEPYVDEALTGTVAHYRMTRSHQNTHDRTFDIRYYPLENDAGEVRGVVATMRDLTPQIERENQLTTLDRLLRHTLRNELNVIQSWVDTIRHQVSEDVTELTTPIDEAVDRILTQAEKEREILQVLSGPSSLELVSLETVVSDVTDELATEYPQAEITVDQSEGIHLTTLPEIGRALYELVENALAHTDNPAEVTVSVREGANRVCLLVSDNGPGIPPEVRAVISEDEEIDPLIHSSGMGLWLVKRIVTRADGTLRFVTSEADGTTVEIKLPRNRPVP